MKQRGNIVDFNLIEDVSLPMTDVLKFSILNRRAYVVECMNEYDKVAPHKKGVPTHIIRASLIALFREVRASILKDYTKQKKLSEFLELEKGIKSHDYDLLEKSFNIIDEYLHAKSVTKYDTNTRYDKTSTTTEDKQRGL